MKIAVILGLAACKAVLAAVALDESSSLPRGELGWSGSVTPGGPEVEYWGEDLDDIEAKIRKTYPEFSIYGDADAEEEESDVDITDDLAILTGRALESRQWGNRVCKYFGGQVNPYNINSGISHLNRVKGSCRAKKRTCIRNTCTNNHGIGMCNKNNHDIKVACTQIARMAKKVKNDCYKFDSVCRRGTCADTNQRTGGEVFSKGHTWSVIVGGCSWFGSGGSRGI